MSSEHVFSLQTPKNPVVSEASPRTMAKAAQRSDGNDGRVRRREQRAMNAEGWLLLGNAKEHSQSFRCTEVRWKRDDQRCAPAENGLTPPGSREHLPRRSQELQALTL